MLAKREEVTQASLSEVRQLIAEDGWKGAYPWMFGSCDNEAHSCYDIYVTATVNTADAGREVDATLIDELRENGWRSAKKPPYCHGDNITSLAKRDGQRLCVQQDDDTISVSPISPHYWGSLFALRDAAGPGILIFEPKSRDQYATYRWNEWASSDL